MPKVIDPATRREHVADAVLQLVAERGVPAATLRNVADRAGLNVGSVRHYFADHAELLTVAATVMAERVGARVVSHLAKVDSKTTNEEVREVLLDAICELLPLDEMRRAECLIFLAFAEHSRTAPQLNGLVDRLFDGPVQLAQLAYSRADLDADARAAAEGALAALIDGLTLRGVHQNSGLTPQLARRILITQLRATDR